MVTINLANLELSDVKYERSVFPDGENHIKLLGDFNRKEDYSVICRITNASELFELMQIGDILNRQGVEWDLYIIYLMSMRMDRVINFNEAFSLKVVTDVINGMQPRSVSVFHAHSQRTESLLNNVKIDEFDFDIFDEIHKSNPGEKIVTCYPDSGAAKRYKSSDIPRYQSIVLNKVRDLDNKGAIKTIEIVETNPMVDENYEGIIVVEDDLCDAGGTFVLASKILKENYPKAKLYIYVRHMVNAKGIANLSQNYDLVFFTSSYKDWAKEMELPENVVQL